MHYISRIFFRLNLMWALRFHRWCSGRSGPARAAQPASGVSMGIHRAL